MRIGNNPLVEWADKGADVNAKDSNGMTALMVAETMSRFEVIKLLLDKGADVNAKDNNGQTVLSYASYFINDGIVNLLKAHGAK